MIHEFWQFTKADGDPDWPVGADNFLHMWNRAYDLLRFHRGDRFYIEHKSTGETGPLRKLGDIGSSLRQRMEAKPNDVFRVWSGKDHFGLAFRLHTEEVRLLGEKFLDIGRQFMGAPYKLGGTTGWGIDCSGLVMEESEPFGITYAAHKASIMWAEFRQNIGGKITIDRGDILKGDLLVFHGGDHIATYIDDQYGGRVLDAQPHSVTSPWGWTPAGTQVRSMAPNYYCSWAAVEDVCRLVKINGEP